MSLDSIRLHPPTGLLRADQVELLARVSADAHGSLVLAGAGDLRLEAGPEAIDPLQAAGLRVHAGNTEIPRVLCSPMTGRVGGYLDARALALRLEHALRVGSSVPAMIGVDDGAGDIGRLGMRLVFAAVSRSEFAVVVDGEDTGATLPHGSDTDGALTDWLAAIARHDPDRTALAANADAIPIGWLEHARGGLVTLGAAVAGGVLDARQVQFLAALERPVVLTPWRTMLLCDLDVSAAEQVVRVLAPMGFVFDAESPVVADLAN